MSINPCIVTAKKSIAEFTATPIIGIAPLTVQFTDKTINSPTKWAWNFGDYIVSNMDNPPSSFSKFQNPSHTYTKGGHYTVSLTASNSYDTNTIRKFRHITVLDPLDASFVATPSVGLAPLTVQFTDNTLHSPTSWLWDFGDKQTSTLQNPSHVYSKIGIYTVSLTVKNERRSDTQKKVEHIIVTNPIPAIPNTEFIASASRVVTTTAFVAGSAPLRVNFFDRTENSPTSWLWDFGDKTSSILQNPTHLYTTRGTYNVRLITNNSTGSKAVIKLNYISVV